MPRTKQLLQALTERRACVAGKHAVVGLFLRSVCRRLRDVWSHLRLCTCFRQASGTVRPCRGGSSWRAVTALAGEHAEQVVADLVPDRSGKGPAAPQVAPGETAAGAASTRWDGLVADQDGPQRGDEVGVVTSALELVELVPHRVDHPPGVGSASQATIWAGSGIGGVDVTGSGPVLSGQCDGISCRRLS